MVIAGTPRLLGEILVQEGLTTPDVVERALTRAQANGELIGEALVALGAVTAEDVLRAVAQQHGLPYLGPDELPSALPVLKNLSPKYLRQNTVCPVSVEGGLLTVACADPLNPMILDDLRQSTGLNVKIVVSPASASSMSRLPSRTTGASKAKSRRWLMSSSDSGWWSGPAGPRPSTIFCSAVLAP